MYLKDIRQNTTQLIKLATKKRATKMKQKPTIVHSHDIHLDSEYVQWLCEIKQRYQKIQIKTAIKVNSEQLLFYWQLGRDLDIRKATEKWGSGIIEQVSLDLQSDFPTAKGFSTRNLWNIKRWYLFYTHSLDSMSLLKEESIKMETLGRCILTKRYRWQILNLLLQAWTFHPCLDSYHGDIMLKS